MSDAKQDPAYAAVLSRVLRHEKQNSAGELNDARSIFLSRADYCKWADVTCPTLIIHDRVDPLVPIIHADEAASALKRATLRTYRLGGHLIYLGEEARKMHSDRVSFLHHG